MELIQNQVKQSTTLLHEQLRSCLDVLDPAVDRIEPEEIEAKTDDETPKPQQESDHETNRNAEEEVIRHKSHQIP